MGPIVLGRIVFAVGVATIANYMLKGVKIAKTIVERKLKQRRETTLKNTKDI